MVPTKPVAIDRMLRMVRHIADAGVRVGRSGSRTIIPAKIGCRRIMPKSKNASNKTLFHKDARYVITPTYDTEEELDAAVAKLDAYAKHFHPDGQLPQRTFLHILGQRQPIGSREHKNNVILENRKKVHVKTDTVDYWYMKFEIVVTNRSVSEKRSYATYHDLNTYAGGGSEIG